MSNTAIHHVEVLGFDCAACRKTYRVIDETAHSLALTIYLEKVDDPARMLAYRVMRVPAVVVNGDLVFSGGVPSRRQIEAWLIAPPK